ncbi:MerR family transcriptional regulator [Desulfotruncus alcoholivorax]|uniref:MerR family transcriptional regulator n=1 Tax=Desulfotruncus alcoholivorax TaxID=265477 RepID=UPI00214E7F85|nr:MerR family transcriptional regulator [Desulfotruncus alcoholivorax]
MGEIARLAGVSRRTIDYYTNLGLLEPVRSESNYRFYTDKSLLRLKIIEVLKANRFTLEEIKRYLSQLNDEPSCSVTIDLLKKQFKQIESQLVKLQPAAVAGLDEHQAVQMRNKIMLQGIALVQSLLVYLNEVTSSF